MPDEAYPAPDDYQTVMLSRSFSEFEEHRAALTVVLQTSGIKVAMLSHHELTTAGVIRTSLGLVQHSAALAIIIGPEYGYVPADEKYNPDKLSIAELEFNEALRLGRPVLAFRDAADVSARRPQNQRKVERFLSRVENITLIQSFLTLEDFRLLLPTAVAMLARRLKSQAEIEERLRAEEVTRSRAEEDARSHAEAEVRQRAELEARIRAEVEAKLRAEEEEREALLEGVNTQADTAVSFPDGSSREARPGNSTEEVPPSAPITGERPLVFISASNIDSEWRIMLERRLNQYKKDIEWWDDSKLEPGMAFEDELDAARSRADIAVLLLSTDYLSSRNAIAEMAILSARAKSKGGLSLFPIVIHDCEWQNVPEIRGVQIWDKGNPLDRLAKKERSLEIQKIADNILKLIGKEQATPSPPIDNLGGDLSRTTAAAFIHPSDPENLPTPPGLRGFSPNAQLIVDKANSLAKESGRNCLTSSCLLFAFAESEVTRNNPVVEDMLASGQYSTVFKAFLTGSDRSARSNPVETSIGLASKNVDSVIGFAEKVAFRVSKAKTIHHRHLLAALLTPPGLKGRLGAHRRLKAMGLERSHYLGRLLEGILKSEPDDDRVEWRSVLAFIMPGRKPESLASFQEGPAGYTAEFVGVGGERAVADYLFVGTHADRLAELIALRETKLPLAIGLFGNWGSGKSHFMNLIDRRLKGLMEVEKKRAANASPKWCREIVPIYFNAWHYLDTNLWASLVAQIFESLFAHLSPRGKDLEQVQAMLEQASGATARAAEELAIAESATKQAQKELATARETRVNAETFVDGVLQGLRSLLPDVTPEKVQQEASKLLGIEKEIETLEDLRDVAEEANSLSTRTQGVFKNVWKQPGRAWRMTWLLTVVGGGALITAIVVWYLPGLKDRLAPTGRAIATMVGAISAFGLWLGPLLAAAGKRLTQIEDWTKKAESEQQRLRETKEVQQAAQKVTVATAKEEAAKLQLAEAQTRESQLKEEAENLAPGRRLGRYIEQRAQSADYRGQLGLVSLARRDFQELSNLFADTEALKDRVAKLRNSAKPEGETEAAKIEELSRSIDRIVLFVDDLDRCQPEKIVEILQAVHLLLAFPLFAVVVGVDQRALRQSLRMQFKGLLTPNAEAEGLRTNVNERIATPLDYLEKIFHVPFHLPAMGQEGFAELISKLTEPSKDEPSKAQSEDAPRQTPPVQKIAEEPVSQPALVTPQATTGSEQAKSQQLPSVEQIQREQAGAERVAAEQVAAELVGSVPLSEWERRALREYYRLIQTPRAAKRLLNTYRLVRAGIPKEEWADFSAGEYRIAMLLLAAAAGYPATAREWFSKLSTSNPEKVLEDKSFVSLDPVAWTQFKNVHKATFSNEIPKLAPENTTKWIRRVEAFTF